jgi:hypothetical protein
VPRATAAISSHRSHPWLSPTLAARGNPVPCSPTRSRRRRRWGGGGRARSCAARREAGAAPPTAKPEPPARRSRTRESHTRLRPLLPRLPLRRAVLRPLPAPPPSSSQRRAPFTDACTSARGHPGEDAASPPLWTPRPSSRGGTPPRRRAAACEAGHRARLGCQFMLVPPPSSTRAPLA